METISIPAYLIVEGPGGKREFPLVAGTLWKIGRSEKCAIVINDDAVSRNHAMIQRVETGEYYLVDMGSRNGSFVNDRRVSTPVVLRNADRITLGSARLAFLDPSQTPRGQTPASVGNIGTTKILFAQCLVSVLVVDIRGYTGLAQAVSQAVLCQVIGGWFGEADRIMQKRGSAGQKYIGDAVMALWLHRTKGDEQTEILEILLALSEFARATAGLKQRLGLTQEFRIGAGLNTGVASLGNPGTREVMDFTALGDSVNAAFRLESASKELGTDVVLGEKSFGYLQLLPAAEYFMPGEAKLKGYEVPAKTWYISFARLEEFLGKVDLDRNPTKTAS